VTASSIVKLRTWSPFSTGSGDLCSLRKKLTRDCHASATHRVTKCLLDHTMLLQTQGVCRELAPAKAGKQEANHQGVSVPTKPLAELCCAPACWSVTSSKVTAHKFGSCGMKADSLMITSNDQHSTFFASCPVSGPW
jgi:hypothetical protein